MIRRDLFERVWFERALSRGFVYIDRSIHFKRRARYSSTLSLSVNKLFHHCSWLDLVFVFHWQERTRWWSYRWSPRLWCSLCCQMMLRHKAGWQRTDRSLYWKTWNTARGNRPVGMRPATWQSSGTLPRWDRRLPPFPFIRPSNPIPQSSAL